MVSRLRFRPHLLGFFLFYDYLEKRFSLAEDDVSVPIFWGSFYLLITDLITCQRSIYSFRPHLLGFFLFTQIYS